MVLYTPDLFIIKLSSSKRLAGKIHELTFTKPRNLFYNPGQYIRFHYNGEERDYTPVSSSVKEDTIRICVQQERNDGFSARLCRCESGEIFSISGPYGHFLYRPGSRPSVWVGTGTGVAPFVAFSEAGGTADILLHGARHRELLVYRKQLQDCVEQYVPCLTQDPESSLNEVFQGRVTKFMETTLAEGGYRFYLCGGSVMILDAMDIIDRKFPGSLVFTERFN